MGFPGSAGGFAAYSYKLAAEASQKVEREKAELRFKRRDLFAAAALQGLLAGTTHGIDPEDYVGCAWGYADDMLDAEEEKTP
jgi:hypothetical protein